MSHHQETNQRDMTIDALRGFAVLIMILSHVIFFYHDGSIGLLNITERFINTIALTIFVFVSGMALAKSDAHTPHITLSNRLKKTFLYILTIYLVYAALVIAFHILSKPAVLTSQIVQSLLFVTPPSFMEYMILFMVLPLLSLAPTVIKYVRVAPFYSIAAMAVGIYFLGIFLYPAQATGLLEQIKIVLAGQEGLLRFPLLFYLPVYLFGIWWVAHNSWRVMTIITTLAILSHFVSSVFTIPLFSTDIRWPPSIGFLLLGTSSAMILFSLLKLVRETWKPHAIFRYLVYVGKDSLDFWLSHLLLIFILQKMYPFGSANFAVIAVMYLCVVVGATGISSIGLTNSISFRSIGPISFIPHSGRRFRKRYLALLLVSSLAIFATVLTTKTSTRYGSHFPSTSFSELFTSQQISSLQLSSARQWHIRRGTTSTPIRLTLTALQKSGAQVTVDSSKLEIYAGPTSIPIERISPTRTGIEMTIKSSQFPVGSIELVARLNSGTTHLDSNRIAITVTEPLLVAWTFDWEGWGVQNNVIDEMIHLKRAYPFVPYTHFVNPRTFLSNEVQTSDKNIIREYLLTEQQAGNEIALHLHMHYDLVKDAGVLPRTSSHWGMRSHEGYDVPTTGYSPDEFFKILIYGKQALLDQGFLKVHGYRAGGWFITEEQLSMLDDAGFRYDSSGRDKPTKGAFTSIPWNLPLGAQPYRLQGNSLLEIPNNGASTFEQSTQELKQRILDVYRSGPLLSPKTLVFVSHPQFADKEFRKIPDVLNTLLEQSFENDAGPIIFSRVSDIESLWRSL